jgi:hypothetical protein
MLKPKFLSVFAAILLSLAMSSILAITSDAFFATCTGADPCHACKNRRYCRHCAKEGGTCGVCKWQLEFNVPAKQRMR